MGYLETPFPSVFHYCPAAALHPIIDSLEVLHPLLVASNPYASVLATELCLCENFQAFRWPISSGRLRRSQSAELFKTENRKEKQLAKNPMRPETTERKLSSMNKHSYLLLPKPRVSWLCFHLLLRSRPYLFHHHFE